MSPTERKAFAETIRPAVKGQSDKFSWRLHRRAIKNGRERVYLMAWNFLDGYRPAILDDLKADYVPARQIAIGSIDREFFHGNTLHNICTPGTPAHDWAFGPGHHVGEWIDITDWFWESYLRTGRCRFWKYEHNWQTINRNSRKCAHCGKHARRSIVTIKKIERREVWA